MTYQLTETELQTIKEFQAEFPDAILTGTCALMMYGLNLGRAASDIDFILPEMPDHWPNDWQIVNMPEGWCKCYSHFRNGIEIQTIIYEGEYVGAIIDGIKIANPYMILNEKKELGLTGTKKHLIDFHNIIKQLLPKFPLPISGAKKEDIQPVLRWVKAGDHAPIDISSKNWRRSDTKYPISDDAAYSIYHDGDRSTIEWLEELSPSKESQKQSLIDIMEADQRDGIYGVSDNATSEVPCDTPFNCNKSIEQWRKKPVVIQAIQWDGTYNGYLKIKEAFPDLIDQAISYHEKHDAVGEWKIRTLEGSHIVSVNDFVIKGVKGEFYTCKPDIFKMTYEPVLNKEQNPERSVETMIGHILS